MGDVDERLTDPRALHDSLHQRVIAVDLGDRLERSRRDDVQVARARLDRDLGMRQPMDFLLPHRCGEPT